MNKVKEFLKKWRIGLLIHEFFWQIPYILYFNYRYLPLKQAKHLPIFLRVRSLRVPKGTIIIDSDNVKTGMIVIGAHQYYYQKPGIYLKNEGTIIFKGGCWISNANIITVLKDAQLIIGNNSGISTSKITCARKIEIGDYTFIGMDCSIMDSDFHSIIDVISKVCINSTIPVKIGDFNWLGAETMVMKGAKTPNHVIISARSILNKIYKIPSYSCLIASVGQEVVLEGYIRDWKNIISDGKFGKIDNIDEVIEQLK